MLVMMVMIKEKQRFIHTVSDDAEKPVIQVRINKGLTGLSRPFKPASRADHFTQRLFMWSTRLDADVHRVCLTC